MMTILFRLIWINEVQLNFLADVHLSTTVIFVPLWGVKCWVVNIHHLHIFLTLVFIHKRERNLQLQCEKIINIPKSRKRGSGKFNWDTTTILILNAVCISPFQRAHS